MNDRRGGATETHDTTKAAPRRIKVTTAVVLGSLTILSALVFFRVPQTTVALEVSAREIGFGSTEQQPLVDRFRVDYVGILTPGVLVLPPSREHRPATYRAPSLVVWAESVAGDSGHVTIRELIVSDSARVRVRAARPPDPHVLTLHSKDSEIRLTLRGPVHLGVPGEMDRIHHFDRPRTLLFRPDTNRIVVEFAPRTSRGVDFFSQIRATELDLTRPEVFRTHTVVADRTVSSLATGLVRFESIGGEERLLYGGQWLEFGKIDGVIRQLGLKDDLIQFSFDGDVEKMRVGTGQQRRNLMPRLLEWLTARRPLTLMWGAIVSLIGLYLAATKALKA